MYYYNSIHINRVTNMKLKQALIIAFLLFTVSLTVSNVAKAISFKGIGILPAFSNAKIPFSDSWFIYNLLPEEIKNDTVLITNGLDETVKLKIYAVDATTTADGALALMSEVDERTGIGAWTKLSQSTITLGPHEEKKVNFTITMPSNVAPGDYLGGIIIENVKLQKNETINIKTRIGVRIYQTVPGELIKKLILNNFDWRVNQDNKIVFTFSLQNKGNLRVEPQGYLVLNNDLLHREDKVNADLRMVLPGKNTIVPVVWEKTPLIGTIRAKATITYGEAPSDKIVQEIAFFYINKWLKIGLIMLAVICLGALVLHPAKKRKK